MLISNIKYKTKNTIVNNRNNFFILKQYMHNISKIATRIISHTSELSAVSIQQRDMSHLSGQKVLQPGSQSQRLNPKDNSGKSHTQVEETVCDTENCEQKNCTMVCEKLLKNG